MTEQEWLTSGCPRTMIDFLGRGLDAHHRPAGQRKLRLFSAAAWRNRAQFRAGTADGLRVPEVAERMADGAGLDDDAMAGFAPLMPNAASGARHMAACLESPSEGPRLAAMLRDIVGNPFRPVRILAMPKKPPKGCGVPAHDLECAACGVRLYGERPEDVCRRRERPVWLTPQSLSLAQAAYDQRNDDGSLDHLRLAVLADCLEEAGCPAEEKTVVTVTAGMDCPVCGGAGWWRRGVHFDHMRKCSACDASGWEPGEDYTFRKTVPSVIVAALRSPGAKYRGFWPLDLILRKE
jgi:hypothetical protein